MIRIKITGLEKLALAGKAFLNMRPLITQTIDQRMQLFGRAVVDRAKSHYLSGRPGLNAPTGRLRGSINYRVTGDTTKELAVGTNVIYGRIHEYGGTIFPKKGQFLKFNIGGKTIFARKVTIPARPYLHPSVEDETPVFAKALQKTLRDVVINGLKTGGA